MVRFVWLASLVVAASIVVALAAPAPSAAADPAADWIYFDLGEVIVTGNPTAGYTYVPGAIDFLKDMRIKGFKLALVSNIPESWGPLCSQKYAGLQTFLGTRLHETVPMDWTLFDKVVLPPFDRYRKPHHYMFMRALENACPGRSLYVGEAANEIAAARDLGFAAYKSSEHLGVAGPLPSEDAVSALLEDEFSFQSPAECAFGTLIHDLLLPQDQAAGVEGCAVVPVN